MVFSPRFVISTAMRGMKLELNTRVYNINIYINCVNYPDDLPVVVAI